MTSPWAREGRDPDGRHETQDLARIPPADGTPPVDGRQTVARGGQSDTARAPDRLSSLPIHPILLAAYPILFLLSQNLGEAPLGDVIPPLVVAIAVAVILLVVLRLVLRDWRRAALIVSAVAITVLAYGHGQRLAAAVHVGGVSFAILWLGVPLLVTLYALRARDSLTVATSGLNVVSIVLVILVLVTIVPFEVGALTASRATTNSGITGSGAHTTRDIWYIVLDRYGSERALQLNYGVTDNALLGWLRERGFIIPRHSHANYVKTQLSLAATLNLTYLDDVVRQQGVGSADERPLRDMVANDEVGRFLKRQGYRYLHVGPAWGGSRISAIADSNWFVGGPTDFQAAVLDDSILPRILRRLGIAKAPLPGQRHAEGGQFEFAKLSELRSVPGPKYVFAHILLPHPPYVFAADGAFRSEAEQAKIPPDEQFRQQLIYTNKLVQEFVEPLAAIPEVTRPIIIIQADEGPYPLAYRENLDHYDWSSATDNDFEIKFGILNAMLLPGVDPSEVHSTISSVNTFRLVFDRYFGTSLGMLPDRSFTSASRLRPYDLIEITNRLEGLN